MTPQLLDIKWPEALFYAESERQEFRNARLVTAKAKYEEIAINMACNKVTVGGIEELWEAAIEFMDAKSYSVREHVSIDKDVILVCINTDTIDDNASLTALDMVKDALYQLDGKVGTVYFGEELSFDSKDIPWLRHNMH